MEESQSMMNASVSTARDAGVVIDEISSAVSSISGMNIQIATAIAGGKQLFARLRVALQHNDLCSGGTLCRRQRGCKTGGTAAQNEDVRHPDTCLSQ